MREHRVRFGAVINQNINGVYTMTMDEKFKQVEDWQSKIDAELYDELEPTDQF